ncbi:hypothetical protein MMC24_005770 [Lignoscripta atroalba]|nr:hypothetical protein [Lignoscripta atroalba]
MVQGILLSRQLVARKKLDGDTITMDWSLSSRAAVQADKPPTALLPTTNHRQDILTTASSSFAERHPTTSPHAIQGQPPAELLTTIQEPAPEPEPEPEPSAQASKRPSFPNRIVRGSLPRALFRTSRQFRRPPAASLWNPINSSPRSTGPHNTIPSVSFEHSNPDQTLPLSAGKDEYPLLTLPEQRRSRRGSPNSLFAEHSAISDNPGSPTRIAVPHHTHQHGHPQSSVSKGKQPIRYGAPPPSTMEGPLPVSSPVHSKELQVDLERGPRSIHSHPSHHSIRTNTTHASHRLPSPTNSIAWGPSHPCFPHPNPHVPLSSPLYKSTRIVRIRRDWTICGDLAPTFTNTYPEILSPWVSEQDFRILITKVNEILIRTFDPWSTRNWLDGLLGLLTGWFWDDLGLTGVKKGVREVEGVVEGWNKERVDEGIDGDDEGEFKVISLRRTGFMSLDFQIPDPHIDRIDPDATSRAGTRPSTAAANGGNPRSGGAASVVNEEETQRERERARGRERERERERDSDMEKIAENL